MKVVYISIRDVSYPRNRMICEHLRSHFSAEVVFVERTRYGYLRNLMAMMISGWRASKGASLIVLAEFSLTDVFASWLVARFRRAIHVVDWFVGVYETRVEDHGSVGERSVRAHLFRLIDFLALFSADVVLTDTDYRASILTARRGCKARAVALPVGAPGWAHGLIVPRPHGARRRILYYGNYLPLHGIDRIIRAIHHMHLHGLARDLIFTFLGNGPLRPAIQQLVLDLGVSAYCVFEDSVPETSLYEVITTHDVVLGVFGDSPKAKSVIPNKVWQGLYCGRPVITQNSAAYVDVRVRAQGLLSEVLTTNTMDLATCIYEVAWEESTVNVTGIRALLDEYISARFDLFSTRVGRLTKTDPT